VNRFGEPDLGLGLGARGLHVRELLARSPDLRGTLGFLELLTENHLDVDPRREELTLQLAAAYPVVLHGVSLNVGSVDPLDRAYLRKVAALAERTRARWVSDHLCWTSVDGWNSHDLLPLPYTDATLRHVAARVRAVQDLLGRRIALENPSSYLRFAFSTMDEAEFMARLCDEADCALLLDVNNVYVSATNHGFDAHEYLAALPADRVVQIHLAGHSRRGGRLIDTHDAPVADPVWQLYEEAIAHCGTVSTLLEWDARIPALDALCAELAKAAPLRARAGRMTRHAA
jgi:uncharacterized protein